MSYQLFIVRHSRKFEYPSWLQYDTEYRQWAAANNSMELVSDPAPDICLYTFTAHGKASTWCPICQVDGGNHTFDCPSFFQNAAPPPLVPNQPRGFQPWTNRPLPPPYKRQKPSPSIRQDPITAFCTIKITVCHLRHDHNAGAASCY